VTQNLKEKLSKGVVYMFLRGAKWIPAFKKVSHLKIHIKTIEYCHTRLVALGLHIIPVPFPFLKVIATAAIS